MPKSIEPYYGPRCDVLSLISPDASVVYDVGCGTGLLGEALRMRSSEVQVYGVEPLEIAAQEASRRLTEVVVQGAEQPPPDHWPAPDVLVFADVLEHMIDPWASLQMWSRWLKPRTKLVVSVPNVLHMTVLEPLLRKGRWDYRDNGVMDRTHLRFFTRDTAAELLAETGFEIEYFGRNTILPPRGWWRFVYRWARRLDREVPGVLPRPGVRLLDPFSQQYLFVAQVSSASRQSDA